MPPFGPIGREDLMRSLRRLGFEGPISGGRHQYMVRATQRVGIPNPHGGVVGRELLARLLRQAGIQRGEWEQT